MDGRRRKGIAGNVSAFAGLFVAGIRRGGGLGPGSEFFQDIGDALRNGIECHSPAVRLRGNLGEMRVEVIRFGVNDQIGTFVVFDEINSG